MSVNTRNAVNSYRIRNSIGPLLDLAFQGFTEATHGGLQFT